MTEDEAKAKWCPHARIANDTGAFNTEYAGGRVVPSSFCIASACMAWRALPSGDTTAKINAIREHRERHGSSLVAAKDAVEAAWVETSDEGFCGLAGSPQ